MHKVYALYVRVSTEAQAEEGYSIGAQTERLTAYCTAMGYSQYDTYVDAGCSGSNLDRPRMQQLIADVKQGKIAAVLVYKLDRLSRSQKDTLYLIEDVFLPHQVDFISLGESIDTSTPYGRAMIGILSAFAQLERENIFLRTRMGMLERVKSGYWMGGGKIPFGYDYDATQGILVPNTQAEAVKNAYQRYISGDSPAEIARFLGFSHDRQVTELLKRRSYLGLIPYKGKEYPGRHQPIIDAQTHALAMEKMRQRATIRSAQSPAHLLSGLVFCGGCGGRMRYIKWGKNGYKLRCYAQDASKAYMAHNPHFPCDAPAVWASEVEQVILADLLKLSVKIEQGVQISHGQSTANNLSARIASAERKLRRLYDLYAQAEDDYLLDSIKSVRDSIKSLQDAQKSQKKQVHVQKQADWLHGRLANLAEAWPLLSIKEQQQILRDCVERIVISGEDIQIYYTLDFV